ncbi:MAG: hypothetical protein KF842_03775 [Caulobacter sp.]|nr:hypothetical protein [Caulobacter sp.]
MNSPLLRMSLAASIGLALLAGCNKQDKTQNPADTPEATPPQAAAPAAPAPAPANPPLGPDQSVTPEGATVSVGSAAAKVATPAYAPIYPGAVVASSVIGESGVGSGGSVDYRVDASPATVIAFYEARMKKIGKTISMKQDMGDNVHMLTAGDSGDGRGAVQVIASPSGKGAKVELTWSDE